MRQFLCHPFEKIISVKILAAAILKKTRCCYFEKNVEISMKIYYINS